jgi:hypothetical protein
VKHAARTATSRTHTEIESENPKTSLEVSTALKIAVIWHVTLF